MHRRRPLWYTLFVLALGPLVVAGCDLPTLPELADGPSGPAVPGRAVSWEGCYDGDTCTFDAFEASVRLARIDAPEIDGLCDDDAVEAREALRGLLADAGTIRVDSLETGVYGRVIGEVYADTVNASDWMLEGGWAVAYGEATCP